MFKRTVRIVGVVGVGMLALGLYLGGKFGLPGFGGNGDTLAPSAVSQTTVPASVPDIKGPVEKAPPELVIDGVLTVRIEGTKLLVGAEEWSADAVAKHAQEHHARVKIVRAEDAVRRAREQLVQALESRQVHFEVQ